MPTSTPWAHRWSDQIKNSEPGRPLPEIIEPLSPAQSTFLHTSDPSSFGSPRTSTGSSRYQGLGLLDTSFSTRSSLTQPDHLYLDHNGGAHVGARVRSANYAQAKPGRGKQSRRANKTTKPKHHTRSGSTIDDLANAAIATSPTFVGTAYAFGGSPTSPAFARPATSYINGWSQDQDRPAKRVKSEKLNAMEWSPRQEERPKTSHAYQSPRTEDAELLLMLSKGHTWGTHASPILSIPQLDNTDTVEKPTKTAQTPELTAQDANISGVAQPVPDISVSTGTATATTAISSSDVAADSLSEPASLQNAMSSTAEHHNIQNNGLPSKLMLDNSQTLGQEDISTHSSKTNSHTRHPPTKKPRKVRPVTTQEVCSMCNKLQRDGNDEEGLTNWIGCEYCKRWYHTACAGFKDKSEARSVDKYFCKDCERHGKTTFVRKSSRARTAIDYAGLNQGVVKPSDESSVHHYIPLIKEGKLKILPDDFARVRPELLTAEFWENMDGTKRPFVVPACWNPRFGETASVRLEDNTKAPSLPTSAHSTSPGRDVTVENKIETVKGAAVGDSSMNHTNHDRQEENVLDCGQDFLDMVMPRNLTVRKVAELYGPDQPVPVIDVKSQETKGTYTLSDWANYYEQAGEKPIRNVISLEVSTSRLGRLIRRPRVVRDIDLEDHVWDADSRSASNKRPVQFYCLMSVADSYTDFHIDFGGSSVYYHILKGVKTFFFIPPEDRYLKKYEEWCNSDTQNDTWLGDLCGGNVTRVDLHEGDTAFIPAGWIHSVWTPEDSLVIGGNFLTRLDYELQLKVFNVEKTTKVPQKFRYPFFQKVMWYSLLKYLDDDPVPEEILQDFYEDPDYQYLRANPVWYEFGELANDSEPGQISYNARIYPKSEVKGLPALRDYLYRTARIHADLPVPDTTKKGIDAVKASIPKGHGDPMRLIKTFAVWCAWKIGNETAPEWFYHDMGPLAEVRDREKVRKTADSFVVPPERVSARKATQAPRTSPVEELITVTTPARLNTDSDESSTKKQRSGSKGAGSTRVACDPCRKRRIKCRHKDGEVSPSSASPAAIRPRTYSNVSVDVTKLASASPVLNGHEPTPAVKDDLPDFGNNSDLAQAALASLVSHSSDASQPALTPVSSSKKGRSKACDECRKSKRRCVHDEYGRVDPAKAAEPSKPRGSAVKRASRPSDEFSLGRLKQEPDQDQLMMDAPQDMAQSSGFAISDAMIDPALMDIDMSGTTFEPHYDDTASDIVTSKSHFVIDYTHSADELHENPSLHNPRSSNDGLPGASIEDRNTNDEHVHVKPVSPPSLVTAQITHLRQSPDHDISYSPITVDGNAIETTEMPDTEMLDTGLAPNRGLRQLSHKPTEEKQVVPAEHCDTPSHVPYKSNNDELRGSTRDTSAQSTIELEVKSRRSSSNTSGTTHQAVTAMVQCQTSHEAFARPVSPDSTASDFDADEKLARELQAEERGLRRRTSMRA